MKRATTVSYTHLDVYKRQAVSCALVPFDEGYASYVDWRTLALLFCLMAVVTGLRFMGVMRLLGSWAVSRSSSMRTLAFALVALTFVSSMAVTNDVALITFVPLALVVLSEMGEGRHTASVVVLMTVAANLGSMLSVSYTHLDVYKRQVFLSD